MKIIIPPHESLEHFEKIDETSLIEQLEPFRIWSTIRKFHLQINYFPMKALLSEEFIEYVLSVTIERIKLSERPVLSGIEVSSDDNRNIVTIKYDHDTLDFTLQISPTAIALQKAPIQDEKTFAEFCVFAQNYIGSLLHVKNEEPNEIIQGVREKAYKVTYQIDQLFRIDGTSDTPITKANNEDVIRKLFGLSNKVGDSTSRFLDFLPYQQINRQDLNFSLDWTFPGQAGEQTRRNIWINLEAPANEDRKLLWAKWVYSNIDDGTSPCDMWCDWAGPVGYFWKQAILGKFLPHIFSGLKVHSVTT